MSESSPPGASNWLAGILALIAAASLGYVLPRAPAGISQTAPKSETVVSTSGAVPRVESQPNQPVDFSPPSEDRIPDNEFGKMVRLGEAIFHDTQGNACSSSDSLRLIRHFEKGGSGSSGLEFKRLAVGAASDGWRWWQV